MRNDDSAYRVINPHHRHEIRHDDLLLAERKHNRDIVEAIREGGAVSATDAELVYEAVNHAIARAGLFFRIDIADDESISATKDGVTFWAGQLSDGERNAFLVLLDLLLIERGTLVLLDEPERHLHPSISRPLLAAMIEMRPDCAFVVATHELGFLDDFPNAPVAIIHGSRPDTEGKRPAQFIHQIVTDRSEIGEELKAAILGGRRNVLFVEGTTESLDPKLYRILFPNVEIVPLGNCRNVRQAMQGRNAVSNLHWIQSYGLVDADHQSQEELEKLAASNIFAVKGYAVESIYYQLANIEAMAHRRAQNDGMDAKQLLEAVVAASIVAAGNSRDFLVKGRAVQTLRRRWADLAPLDDELISGTAIERTMETDEVLEQARTDFDKAVSRKDIDAIVRDYPIKKSGIPKAVAQGLKYVGTSDFEDAFRYALSTDQSIREANLKLFSFLPKDFSTR